MVQMKKSREYSTKNADVDLTDIYADLPSENYIQTGYQGEYQHHSDFWEAQMDASARRLEAKMDKVETQEIEDNDHHPTIDQNELYNGMTLQTSHEYDHHSDFWNAQMDASAQKLEARMQKVEDDEEDNKYHQSMKTENMEKLYKFIALETGDDIYQHHSDFWEQMQNQAAVKLSNKMEKVEED